MQKRSYETLSLAEAMTLLLEECRMVLPGVQALFGFQLVAVFDSRFADALTANEQTIHYLALGLVACAVGIVMTPAAVHRHQGPLEASTEFIIFASRMLMLAMLPLMLGICLDFYLIGRMILHNRWLSLVLAGILLGIFSALWIIFPRCHAVQPKGGKS